MSGPRPDGPDELGLAEVAWQLRSTLADAGDVPVSGDERVLSTIRRRSTQRRRAKRVMSTSVAAFALSLSTLAVVKGGQVAIDHGIARNAEPPAVTPGNAPDDPNATNSTEPTTPGTQVNRGKKNPADCQPDAHTGAVACLPGTPTDPTATVPGDPTDPTSSVPGQGNTSPTSTAPTTLAPTTTAPAPPPLPPPQPAEKANCGVVTPDIPPNDPLCFQRAYDAGNVLATLVVRFPDPADQTKFTSRIWTKQPRQTWVSVEVLDAAHPEVPSTWQCPEPNYVGVGPEWYALNTSQCQKLR